MHGPVMHLQLCAALHPNITVHVTTSATRNKLRAIRLLKRSASSNISVGGEGACRRVLDEGEGAQGGSQTRWHKRLLVVGATGRLQDDGRAVRRTRSPEGRGVHHFLPRTGPGRHQLRISGPWYVACTNGVYGLSVSCSSTVSPTSSASTAEYQRQSRPCASSYGGA